MMRERVGGPKATSDRDVRILAANVWVDLQTFSFIVETENRKWHWNERKLFVFDGIMKWKREVMSCGNVEKFF